MGIKRGGGWNPKAWILENKKEEYNNPQKIENSENRFRDWPTWVDNDAVYLNDEENDRGVAMKKRKNNREVIESVFRDYQGNRKTNKNRR